jgi:hypothetical protein
VRLQGHLEQIEQLAVSLFEELRDTTASVYLVPDMFVTELIQAALTP